MSMKDMLTDLPAGMLHRAVLPPPHAVIITEGSSPRRVQSYHDDMPMPSARKRPVIPPLKGLPQRVGVPVSLSADAAANESSWPGEAAPETARTGDKASRRESWSSADSGGFIGTATDTGSAKAGAGSSYLEHDDAGSQASDDPLLGGRAGEDIEG